MDMRMTTAALVLSAFWIVPAAAQTYAPSTDAHHHAEADIYGDPATPFAEADPFAPPAPQAQLDEPFVPAEPFVAQEPAAIVAGTLDPAQLPGLQNMILIGDAGQVLGTIIAVDVENESVQVQAFDGSTLTIPAMLLSMRQGQLYASTVSRRDVLAMAATQAGNMQLAQVVSNRNFPLPAGPAIG